VERQRRRQDAGAQSAGGAGTAKGGTGGGTIPHLFRLSQELVAVNDRICQLRPARTIEDEEEVEQLKKNCGGISPRSGRRKSNKETFQ